METAEEFIKRKNEQFIAERDNKKPIGFKHITRTGRFYFLREDWTFLIQSDYPQKVFVLERLRFVKSEANSEFTKSEGAIEYRVGYFIVGKIGNRKNKWKWGQYCPIIPSKDFQELLKLAKEKGFILDVSN